MLKTRQTRECLFRGRLPGYFSKKMTADLFFDALRRNEIDDAKTYLSRHLRQLHEVDLSGLSNAMSGGSDFVFPAMSVRIKPLPEGLSVSTVILNGGQSNGRVISLYMVNEPDAFSDWKIINIEEE